MDSGRAEQSSKKTRKNVQLGDLKSNKDPVKEASVLQCCSSINIFLLFSEEKYSCHLREGWARNSYLSLAFEFSGILIKGDRDLKDIYSGEQRSETETMPTSSLQRLQPEPKPSWTSAGLHYHFSLRLGFLIPITQAVPYSVFAEYSK